jgi:hypothetical protein
MGRESAGGLHPKAGTPVTSTRFPLRSLPESTSSVVDVAPKGLAIAISFINGTHHSPRQQTIVRRPDLP